MKNLLDLVGSISSVGGSGIRGIVLEVIVKGQDEMLLEVRPGFVFWCLLAPLFALTIKQTGVFNVLISPSDKLGIVDDFVSSGGEFLSFFELVKQCSDRFRRGPGFFMASSLAA